MKIDENILESKNHIHGASLVAVGFWQGDQMSLLQNRPKCGPTHFLLKLLFNFYPG
jgi:hypothetical protein